jgi:hypothetical protein
MQQLRITMSTAALYSLQWAPLEEDPHMVLAVRRGSVYGVMHAVWQL